MNYRVKQGHIQYALLVPSVEAKKHQPGRNCENVQTKKKKIKCTSVFDMLINKKKITEKAVYIKFNESILLLLNKRPTGLNGHLSIRYFTLNSCQKGAYLHINSPVIIIKIKINNCIGKQHHYPLTQ